MKIFQFRLPPRGIIFLAALLPFFIVSCTRNGEPQDNSPGSNYIVHARTSFDESSLLVTDTLTPGKFNESLGTITIDETQIFQTIDGFGYTLTGGSALHLSRMDVLSRQKILKELFDCKTGICISYLRISIGSSDLDEKVFSYNDLPPGQTDFTLDYFDMGQDRKYLIPVLKEILSINPEIGIMASPWSAPAWMKTNGSPKGGSLKPGCYDVYSRYLLSYLQTMRAEGIEVDALTIQNEPQHGGNNPSMLMSSSEQAVFIKDNLGPLFAAENINTKILIWDHNCDQFSYPLSILKDSVTGKYVDGSAFHLYAGDISAMGMVHDEFPDKHVYFTEQWTGANSTFSEDIRWHSRHILIGSTRNWAKVVLEWNLASDPLYQPHTPGGCSLCKGALTIDGNKVMRNVSYYIIAHMSAFVPPGSKRIYSAFFESVPNVAFIRPDGKKVLFIMNESGNIKSINIKSGTNNFSVQLRPNTINTLLW